MRFETFALLLGAKPSTTKAVRTWHQEPASSHGSGIDRGLDHGTWGVDRNIARMWLRLKIEMET